MKLLPLEIVWIDPRVNVSRGGRAITDANVRSLAEDIEQYGQQEPVGVVTLADALWMKSEEKAPIAKQGYEFVLVYGFRRLQALSMLAHKDANTFGVVRAIEQGPMALSQAELANVAENWSREPPTEFDLTVACDRFVRVHKIKAAEIAKRVNRTPAFVESCVVIVSQVAPDLLEHYRVNCSRENRRRMILLAEIEASTTREKHEIQRRQWDELEANAAAERRSDPQGGIRNKKPRARSGAIVSRGDLREAAERLLTAREFFDGQQWRPIDSVTRSAMREWVRWSLDASLELPVR
jgi:ParB-like chromosome segregation protein Spo0J